MKLRSVEATAATTTVAFILVASLGPPTLSASPPGEPRGASAVLYTNGEHEGRLFVAQGVEEVAGEHPRSGHFPYSTSKQLINVLQGRRRQSSTSVTRGRRSQLNRRSPTSSAFLVAAAVIGVALWRLAGVIRMCLDRYGGQRRVGATARSLSEQEESDECKSLGLDLSGSPGATDVTVQVEAEDEELQPRCAKCDADNTRVDYMIFGGMAGLVGLLALVCLIIMVVFRGDLFSGHGTSKNATQPIGNDTSTTDSSPGNTTYSAVANTTYSSPGNTTASSRPGGGDAVLWGLVGVYVGVPLVIGVLAYFGVFTMLRKLLFPPKKKTNDPNADKRGGQAGDVSEAETGSNASQEDTRM